MRFYRLTYYARIRIKKKINDDGDSFDSLFESMNDELSEMSKGNLNAFLADYNTKRMRFAAAVRNGIIDEYLNEINTYIPCDISTENEIEEITAESFHESLDYAIHKYYHMKDIRDKLGTEKIFTKWGRELDFSEEFIEKGISDYCSPSLKEEIDRINKSGKPQVYCTPVHYIIGGSSENSRTVLLRNLLYELKENGRLTHSRYSTIHLKDCRHHFNTIKEEADELFKISEGGTVVFSIEDKLICDEEKRSFILDLLVSLCKAGEKYAKKTLLIFLLPDNNLESYSKIRKIMKDISFVEINESTMNADESRNYLSCLAKSDNFRANKALYKKIEKGSNYFLDELTSFYNKWCEDTIIRKNFPSYNKFLKKESVRIDKEKAKPDGNAYEELMSMIGLSEAKKVINEAIDYFKAQDIYDKCGFANTKPTMHMVFTGSPGTAKTTAARLFARIMKDNKILSNGVFVEVGRSELVGKYVGWTAQLVKEKFKAAEGGVLFIDEAYSLVEEDGLYGDEAINTIVQEMENKRNDTIVIFAGYSDKMESFLNKNPGLRSRIAFHVPFDDYSPDELFKIAELMSEKNQTILAGGVKEKIIPIFEEASLQPDFGNGRFVRNMMERARMKQASRLVHSYGKSVTREQAATLIPEDFEMPVMNTYKESAKQTIGF